MSVQLIVRQAQWIFWNRYICCRMSAWLVLLVKNVAGLRFNFATRKIAEFSW